MSGETVPTVEEFAALAVKRRVVPVVRRLLADMHTRWGCTASLRKMRRAPSFESAENGRSWSRYSFIESLCSDAHGAGWTQFGSVMFRLMLPRQQTTAAIRWQ